nr:MAG TPA: hypothetical protein [Caudoviricetes sp.]
MRSRQFCEVGESQRSKKKKPVLSLSTSQER